MIECRLLGPLHVLVDGGPAPPELLWRKHIALLIYLARSVRRSRTRDHLIGLLWPDKPEATARHSLNEALRVVRRVAGEGAVVTEQDRVGLAAGAVRLDVDPLDEAIRAERPADAAALVQGEFLEGFVLPKASAFEDWLSTERRFWAGRAVDALTRHGHELMRAGRAAEAVEVAELALTLAPVDERAMGCVLRGLALQGLRAAAQERFALYGTVYRNHVGTPPPPALSALAERIADEPGVSGPVSAGPGGRHSAGRGPLVGRDRELTGLITLWEETKSGAGSRVALVLGDPGTGKSRLVEEVVLRARLDGAVVATVRAVPSDRPQAWSGLDCLAQSGLAGATGLLAARPEALSRFVRRSPDWAERFPRSGEAEPLSEAQALLEVVLAVAGEGPMLLVADDAHFLDEETLATLCGMPRSLGAAPVLLLLTAASHPPRQSLDALRAHIDREIQGGTLLLGPLDASALRLLVQQTFPHYSHTQIERLTRRLATDSAGLPLVARELLRAVQQGVELSGASAWPEEFHTLDQSLPSDLPDSVVAAVRLGARRLPPVARETLAAIALLGERVAESTLIRVLDHPTDEITNALNLLEWERWIVAERRGFGITARILRELLSEDLLTVGHRRRLRERAGVAPP